MANNTILLVLVILTSWFYSTSGEGLDEFIRETFRNVSRELLEEYTRSCSCICPSQPKFPMDCQDILASGNTLTGIYEIFPNGGHVLGIKARCDMDTDNGGWTVIQRRESDSDFYKTWNEYETGFGNLSSNFWLGNKHIADLTAKGNYELRIDMTSPAGESRYVIYKNFSVGGPETTYTLSVSGYTATTNDAKDALSHHNGMKFSTKNSDNDAYKGQCAVMYVGAWWYGACHIANLNGLYGNTEYGKGLNWKPWLGYHASLTFTEMKIRRKNVK